MLARGATGKRWEAVVEGRPRARFSTLEEAVQAVRGLLADPELRARMGAAGRARAAAQFSWEAATAATVVAYRAAGNPGSDAG